MAKILKLVNKQLGIMMQTMASDSLNDNSELEYFHFFKNYEFGNRLPNNLPFNLPV